MVHDNTVGHFKRSWFHGVNYTPKECLAAIASAQRCTTFQLDEKEKEQEKGGGDTGQTRVERLDL